MACQLRWQNCGSSHTVTLQRICSRSLAFAPLSRHSVIAHTHYWRLTLQTRMNVAIRSRFYLEAPEELQEPGSLPLGQALKLPRLLGGALLVSLNSLLQGTRAAIVEKRVATRQPRPHSPESGRSNFIPGLRRHPFTQDARTGPDVVQKEIAVWVKSLVPQRLRHSKGSAID